MSIFSLVAACPHCATPIRLAALQRLPVAGMRRWYQFSARSRSACPSCGGLVRNIAHNSRWLLLAMFSFALGLASLFVPSLSFLLNNYLWAAPAAVGIFFAVKSSRLVPVAPNDVT
jgi:hypothetical protein